jgi:hypothetical protein
MHSQPVLVGCVLAKPYFRMLRVEARDGQRRLLSGCETNHREVIKEPEVAEELYQVSRL